ncbi:talin rod domain-containing protein 1-like [Physella acuta]|uniref:talin rod domain-containing protein 1-like n=1 Tax=Physella acuta TaxID=109671 RepID=UPI0027DC41F0|nr:talin rod domain-containing protein 1-like [Physella acuta]
MMNDNARSIVLIFDESLTRIQTVSELLLISCTPRPVYSRPDDLTLSGDTFVKYRDRVIGQLNKMLILSRDIATQVHGKQIHWKQFCQRVQELTTVVIYLSELSAHIAYLIAINIPGSEPAKPGPVTNLHQLTQAELDIKFSCTRLKRSKMNDLHPHVLVDLCSCLTKSLTTMTDICRHAAEKISDTNDQDQFKLCVKAITSTTGCLVSSIKSFKHSPTETHLQRVVAFCDPVTAASSALLRFASEETFIGTPGSLSSQASEMYKSILGLSMSIASANIQICRAVRDLVYSTSIKRNQDRMSLCVESVTRSSSQLRDLLLSHDFSSRIESKKSPKLSKDFSIPSSALEPVEHHHRHSRSSKNRKEGSQSPKNKEKMLKLTEKISLHSGDKDLVQLTTGDNSISEAVVSPSSRPSSISVEFSLSDVASDDNRQEGYSSPNRYSPSSLLLSPLSTSSLSLESTSSFSADAPCFGDDSSPLADSAEPTLGLEQLVKEASEEKSSENQG